MKILLTLFIMLISISTLFSQWQQLNGPQGGSIKLIEINDEIIFASGESGRLFCSTDNGENWFEAYSRNLWGKITCLDFSGNKIYSGSTGGVFVSTDTAKNWSPVGMKFYTKSVKSIAVTGETIFATVTEEGVFKTTNEGQDWIEADSGLTDKNVNCFAAKNNNIFAGTNSGIYLSTDSGESWSLVDSVLRYKIINNIIISGDNIYASTSGWGIYMSSDAGQSWNSINGNLTNNYIQAFAVKDNNIYAGTSNGLFLTTNNGQNWIEINNGLTSKDINSLAVKGDIIFAGTRLTGIYKSTDNGQSWSSKGLSESLVFELAIENGNLYTCGYKSGMSFSTDDGITWTSLNSGLPDEPSIQTFKISGKNIYGGMYFRGGVYISTDLGANWINGNSGLPSTFVWDFLITSDKVLVGTSAGMFVSTDNGRNWSFKDSTFNNIRIITFAVNGINSYAATEQGLFKSVNNGENWSLLNSNMKDSLAIYSLAFGENRIYAGTLNKGIFVSTDDGVTWTDINSNLNILSHIKEILIYGKNIFIVFGGYGDQGWRCPGIFLSTDNGGIWKPINPGLSSTCANNLVIRGEEIYASTSIGVFKARLSDFELNDIEEKPVTNRDGFDLSPNPADEFLSVNFQDIARKPDCIRLFDMFGNVVYENRNILESASGVTPDAVTIRTREFASGMYFLKVGNTFIKKIIVVH